VVEVACLAVVLVSLSLRLKDLLGPVTRVKRLTLLEVECWLRWPVSRLFQQHMIDTAPPSITVPCQLGTVLDLRLTAWQKCEAVPRRARI